MTDEFQTVGAAMWKLRGRAAFVAVRPT